MPPEDQSIEAVFSSLGDNITHVFGESQVSYHMDNGDWAGSLDSLTAQNGYWLRLENEDSFDIETEQALQDSLFTQRDLLERERQQGIANIGYGAGTGLMIGGWSAFIAQETTTRNQWRTIGTSTVLGGMIGLLLGTRSIWDPAAARPDMGSVETESQLLVKHETSGVTIAYSWNF